MAALSRSARLASPTLRKTSDASAYYEQLSWFRAEQVAAAHVMVVGCGALGNEVLKNLVLLGVGHLTLIDFDRVEASNLTRSVFFRLSDVGRPKVEVLAERLLELYPGLEVQTLCGDVAHDVGLGLVRRHQVVVGCVDSRWARFMINRLCMQAGVPWVDGGIDRLEGTSRVFAPGHNCYACALGPTGMAELRRRMPCSGVIRRQEELGRVPTTPIVASIIGAVQAQEVLKLILSDDNELTSLCGRMFYYEGQHLSTRLVTFQAYDDDCAEHECWQPVCHLAFTPATTVAEMLSLPIESFTLREPFVDYLTRLDTDQCYDTMLPAHRVEEFVTRHPELSGLLFAQLRQHEWQVIDARFPFPQLTLEQLGVPADDILMATQRDGTTLYIQS